jgi:hypothetical protein
MLQIILFLLGLYNSFLIFQAIKGCVLSEAYKPAKNQVIIMFINIALVVYVVYTI